MAKNTLLRKRHDTNNATGRKKGRKPASTNANGHITRFENGSSTLFTNHFGGNKPSKNALFYPYPRVSFALP